MTGMMTAPARAESPTAPAVNYHLALGYLRAFVTVMVVAHHAVLGYHPYAPPHGTSLTESGWWRAFPVLDSQRSIGFAIFVGFNDTFFMSLMFFLSGLFVWNSLQRKGSGTFLRDRVLRLGIPFAVAAALLAPLAYYPSYLQMSPHPSFGAFARQWLSLGDWPAGPAWFVWVLLGFGCVAAVSFRVAPDWAPRLGQRLSKLSDRPVRFLILLVAVTAVAYIPMTRIYDPLYWSAFGPFTFQTTRIFHYLAYFLIAAALGAWGIERGVLASHGKLARRWPAWCVSSLVVFVVVTAATVVALTSPALLPKLSPVLAFGFVLSCAVTSLAFLALFVRFARSRTAIFDSLRDNAYGIYLLHYACVSWLQYTLLGAALPAVVKGTLVFAGALVLSWAVSAALRRVPAVARVL